MRKNHFSTEDTAGQVVGQPQKAVELSCPPAVGVLVLSLLSFDLSVYSL